ncbi:MAG TPA: hypothetical protein VJB65_04945 [Patescibacteria group bacterium]|nr:hypothetical protein [Patescibacteria group bacterium]
MKLRTHVTILSSAKWFIVLFTILCGISALLFSVFQPTYYKSVVAFDVQLVNRSATPDYQYGTYYDLKGAEIYTQAVMSWFLTPAVVEEVYQTAGIGYIIKSIEQFTNRFQTKQYSAQHFVVLFKDSNKENAEKLSHAIIEVIEKRAAESITIDEKSPFSVHALQPVIVQSEYPVWLTTVVGVIVGFLGSIILVYIREYFRN